MLIPTSNFLNYEAESKITNTLNSIKIDYNKLTFTPKSTTSFTACAFCHALLIEQDHKSQIITSGKGTFNWFCRFCKKQNSNCQLLYNNSNYKFPIEKNLKFKITPPIILFIIDNSGSMHQSIFSNMKFANNPHKIAEAKKHLAHKFQDILNQSKLYQMQKKQMNMLQQNYLNVIKNNPKYMEEQVSKLTFLYAMIEYNLKNLVKKDMIKDSRIGFIFFSEMIYVLKGVKQKEIPVYVQEGEFCHDEWPYKKQSVDFYDYQAIYSKGKSYDKYFGDSRIKNLDVSKIAINKAKGGGRTAMGPALALAMGIISMHDQGSRIIIATDSMPNFGILSIGDSQQTFAKMGKCLQQNGANLNILKWSDEILKTKEEQQFTNFQNKYRQHIEVIELNLNKCKEGEGLVFSMTALNNLINKEPIGMSCQVKVYCDNPKIQPQKMDEDFNDYRTLRFLNSNSKCWLALKINKVGLEEYDYLFPVITQIVVKYSDIFTKERYIFMSYIKQYLLKPTPLNIIPNENILQIEQQENINMTNINEICNLQILCFYERTKQDYDEDDQRDQIKTVFKYKQIQFQKQFHNINDIANIKNQMYEYDENSLYEEL